MVDSIGNVGTASLGAIHKDFQPNPKHGKQLPAKPVGGGQLIMTQSGQVVHIRPMLGSSTRVEPLNNGTYKVTYKPSVLNAKEKVTIMTEKELLEKYGSVYESKAQKLNTLV